MKLQNVIWALKGMAMGAADAVPGVSGGTIALVLGIYERFIAALASFKPSLWQYVKARDFKGLWQAIDGNFLLSLGIGILVSLFTVMSLVHLLLETHAPLVWSFFFGVILMSLITLSIAQHWHWTDAVLMLLGFAISCGLVFANPVAVEPTPLALVLGGMLAISAMLLPGISGSFMLLLLGLYAFIVEAVHDRNLVVVAWVALGCLIGVLTTSQILQWALKRWHDHVVIFMLGFIAGALIKVWPWQGEVDKNNEWLLPSQYEAVTGFSSEAVGAVLLMALGMFLIVLMNSRTSIRNKSR